MKEPVLRCSYLNAVLCVRDKAMRLLKLFILTLITGCSSYLENTGSSEYLNIELTEVAPPRYLKMQWIITSQGISLLKRLTSICCDMFTSLSRTKLGQI